MSECDTPDEFDGAIESVSSVNGSAECPHLRHLLTLLASYTLLTRCIEHASVIHADWHTLLTFRWGSVTVALGLWFGGLAFLLLLLALVGTVVQE